MDLVDLTDGWLTDWSESGGRFKEWVRGLHLNAINNGWLSTLWSEPGHWCRSAAHAAGWLPFLWDDKDWDQVYLWKMMREKLRRMRLHHQEDQVVADWERIAKEIWVAELALDRLIGDDYAKADWEAHRAKYGSAFDRRVEREDGMVVWPSSHDSEEGASIRRIAEREWAAKKSDSKFVGQWMARHWFGWWS